MLKPGKSSTASSPTEVKPAQQQPERTEMTPKGAPKDDEVGSWSSSSVQDVHALLAQQDIKYQGMLSQVMQHVMAFSNRTPALFGATWPHRTANREADGFAGGGVEPRDESVNGNLEVVNPWKLHHGSCIRNLNRHFW